MNEYEYEYMKSPSLQCDMTGAGWVWGLWCFRDCGHGRAE